MSAEETDKTTTDASGGDEEEEWLYGDEVEEKAKQDTADRSTTLAAAEDEVHENGAVKQEDEDSDSEDDDDDVCVTIGDIKTGGGGSSQYSAFGTTPVNLNIKTAGRTPVSVGSKPKGVDLDALGNIKGMPVMEVEVESFEKKPWRKPGADLSDYFNYGFNEDTWKSYCEKQRRLRMGYEGMGSATKIMHGRTGHGDKEPGLLSLRSDYTSSSSSSGSHYMSACSRKSSGTIDVIGGQTGAISRVEGRRRHNIEGNNIQVLSELASDAEPTFFPPNIPPPPFLPPHNVGSAPPLFPPPRMPMNVPPPGFPPGALPPAVISILDRLHYRGSGGGRRDSRKDRDRDRDWERETRQREHTYSPTRNTGGARNTHSGRSGGYDTRSVPPPLFPFPTGVYPPIPGGVATSWAGVIDSAKAWEYSARRDRERERDKDRDRREKERERERETRDRKREHSPSSQDYNSEEERVGHREPGERGGGHAGGGGGGGGGGGHHDRTSREREERHRDRRHRDEGRHKSSRSSSWRRHDSDEGDTHRRHKTKRSKEDKELSADQENQSEPTE